ncbi:MAG: O-acetylhomoserine aminocarboxypropyltransferase/cysteine synthase family protein, partial [Terriglobia bacterium]
MTKKNDIPMAFETLAVHSGPGPDPATGASSPAIHQSSSFAFRDTGHAANVFALKEKGFIYSRVTNPTVMALEEKIAALEGGKGATCTSSGLSASLLAAYTLMTPGDEFIASQKIYGGTGSQFRDSFKRAFGWTGRFVDPGKNDAFKAALSDKTRFIFMESLSNPEGVIPDMEAIARIAEDAGIPLIVDNTVATPILLRPFEYGADVVVHSLTKFMAGHGTTVGGAIIDAGHFDWGREPGRFPMLTEPEPSYHGVVYTEQFGRAAFVARCRTVCQRNTGSVLSPLSSFLLLQGLETLPLRMERHSQNALRVAQFLEGHPAVDWVSYPGLESHPQHHLARRYFAHGYGAILGFGIKGGLEAGKQLI